MSGFSFKRYDVTSVRLGGATAYDGGALTIDPAELAAIATSREVVATAEIELVEPGESTRIVHVCDAVEPRHKPIGSAFPGWLGSPLRAGTGDTHRLSGVAVLPCAPMPWEGVTGLLVPRESIVEASGPAATFTPFGQTRNVVVEMTVHPGFDPERYQNEILAVGLDVARRLGETTDGHVPDEIETIPDPGRSPNGLPRVAYVMQVVSQGVYSRSTFYGHPIDSMMPTIMNPAEVLDGSIVNANLAHPAVRIPTWMFQNHPVVRSLAARHGNEVDFAGVILTRGHWYDPESKKRVIEQVTKLVHYMQLDGVIVTWEGGGNGIMEAEDIAATCEAEGVAAVFMSFEYGGRDGSDMALQYFAPGLESIVSTGSLDRPVSLPAVDRVVGGDVLRLRPEIGGQFVPAADAIDFERMLHLFAACNQAGATDWRCVEV
jgi:glycine reductase